MADIQSVNAVSHAAAARVKTMIIVRYEMQSRRENPIRVWLVGAGWTARSSGWNCWSPRKSGGLALARGR